ncbi:unnamed protein product [Didymodactylos carnosus]|uniref:Uncharacterized protein n=1 Tax=Didymodactylos carnosus TaxID=1234261 RepID=A0A814R6P7_9BILA|nr:unnamed protein product [Didymodactylos carnosus]CAF1128464.1 unnamed protein product [Didymodactylos carnosus]CAF3528814.1 unnamed protein product [Didymodactylos carnosus]CAF3891936.1 unnamed protein product [Didymodactylos carnosus]
MSLKLYNDQSVELIAKHQRIERRLSNVWGKRSLERRLSSTWGKRGISSNSDENVLDDLCEQYLLTRRLQEPASRKHEMQHLNSDESNPEVHELYRQPNYLEHTDQEPNEDTSIDETRNLSS